MRPVVWGSAQGSASLPGMHKKATSIWLFLNLRGRTALQFFNLCHDLDGWLLDVFYCDTPRNCKDYQDI